jgi:epoxyqueuosine reductase
MEFFMNSQSFCSTQSRRDFLKRLIAAGSLFHLTVPSLFSPSEAKANQGDSLDLIFKFKTISIDHLNDLQKDIDKIKRSGKISKHPVFKSYIKNKKFKLPENFPEAKFIVVMAVFTKLMRVNFHLDGATYETIIPPQYYDDGISMDDLLKTIQQQIIKEPDYRIEKASQIHLKLLAARSGLGNYGRNNIIFVDGMGSFITLYAFFTDFKFDEDNWQGIKMLEECERCRNCLGICPTSCITKERFVIDVTKCITLYNEIDGKFPKWIHRSWHNALMGCMKCQIPCPANEKVPDYAGRLEDVAEEETRKILQGESDEELIHSLNKKLKGFAPATSKEYFPIFTRNLSVLIKQHG